MRDIKRIRKFCNQIANIWERRCPDWRFGQVLMNVYGKTNRDPFFMEEDETMKLFKDYFAFDDVEYDTDKISDGYHTFGELYHHRAILFATVCNAYPELAWKSKQHHNPDDEMWSDNFIVGIETPKGQATYHYRVDPYWDMFKVKELDRAPEWDGHNAEQAIKRIMSLNIENKENTP